MNEMPRISELIVRIMFCIPLLAVMPFCIVVIAVEEMLADREWR